jgi:hypothetical protein
VWHSGVDEGDGAKKGNGDGRRLLWRPNGVGEEEKGRGSRGSAPHAGENGEERGGGRGVGQLGGRHRPPAGVAVPRQGRAVGRDESGACAADRWGRAKLGPSGSGWVQGGVRGSEAAVAAGADRRGRPAQCRPVRF